MRAPVWVVVLLALAFACSGGTRAEDTRADVPADVASDAAVEGRDSDAPPPDGSATDSVVDTREEATDAPCVPDCTGKVCGDEDGCGGTCTWCPPTCGGSTCEFGYCVALCDCNCDNRECGYGGCEGGPTECGTCPEGVTCCDNGRCGVPDCAGKDCGDDGCGGSCGTCGEGQACYGTACLSTTWADPETGFVWQTAADSPFLNWDAAVAYCAENAGGLPGSGWRLPNVSELRTLIKGCPGTETGGECRVVDVCEPCGTSRACLAEATCFDDAVCRSCAYGEGAGSIGFYTPPTLDPPFLLAWSSSSSTDIEPYAWVVDFTNGEIYGRAKDESSWVQCVRSEP